MLLKEKVGFYGFIFTSTAQNGNLLHPQGKQPLHRTNNQTITIISQEMHKRKTSGVRWMKVVLRDV